MDKVARLLKEEGERVPLFSSIAAGVTRKDVEEILE